MLHICLDFSPPTVLWIVQLLHYPILYWFPLSNNIRNRFPWNLIQISWREKLPNFHALDIAPINNTHLLTVRNSEVGYTIWRHNECAVIQILNYKWFWHVERAQRGTLTRLMVGHMPSGTADTGQVLRRWRDCRSAGWQLADEDVTQWHVDLSLAEWPTSQCWLFTEKSIVTNLLKKLPASLKPET